MTPPETQCRRPHCDKNVEADFGAGIQKPLRDGGADAPCTAGNERTAAGEFSGEIEFVRHERS